MSENGGDTYDNLFDEFEDDFDTNDNNALSAHVRLEQFADDGPAPSEAAVSTVAVVGEKRDRSEESFGSSVGVKLHSEVESATAEAPLDEAAAARVRASRSYNFTDFEELWSQASAGVKQEPPTQTGPSAPQQVAVQDEMTFDDDADFDDWDAPQETTQATSVVASAAVSAPPLKSALPPRSSSFIEDFKKWFPNANTRLATPSIVNVVSVVYLGFGVDLRVLCCSLRNIEYTNKSTPKAILRLMDPQCVAIIRNSGIVMILGASSVSAARMAAELVARLVRITLRLTDMQAVKFRVRCIMVRFDLQHPIRLDELALAHPANASYEPESFCGCLVSIRGYLPPAVQNNIEGIPQVGGSRIGGTPFLVSCSIYTSGKVTMTGAHSVREVQSAYRLLLPLIAPHIKR